ncbi:MAG TPA: hypothetical protein VFG54_00905 [Prolixibacteraceae bacterium]|nr:hypothetical protein [Prolixibacteraceae bacterium]
MKRSWMPWDTGSAEKWIKYDFEEIIGWSPDSVELMLIKALSFAVDFSQRR